MGGVVSLVGKRFGHLVVLGREGKKRQYIAWRCLCDCGGEKVVSGDKLRGGKVISCSRRDWWCPAVRGDHAADGIDVRVEKATFERMWRRCADVRHKNYPHYGGRGIKVCERWGDFWQFLSDMGPRPGPEYSIERRDVDGDYCPENCYWLPLREQGRNQRRSTYIEYMGERVLLIDMCRRIGIDSRIVRGRLKLGWPVGWALRAPVRAKKKKIIDVASSNV